jgi:hypothetical protein
MPKGPKKSLSKRLNRGKAVSSTAQAFGSAVAPHLSSAMSSLQQKTGDAAKYMYENLPEPGATMDELFYYSPLLIDMKTMFKRTDINVALSDKVFYDGMGEFLALHNQGPGSDLIGSEEITMVRNTLRGTLFHSRLPDECRILVASSKSVTKTMMVKFLEAFFAEFIMSDGVNAASRAPMSMGAPGSGFSQVKEQKRLEKLVKDMRTLEQKADTTSQALHVSTLERDINRYTMELNDVLKKIYDHISDKSEDQDVVTKVMGKYNKLTVGHLKAGHDVHNYFGSDDMDVAQKKKRSKRKKRSKKRKQ